jgi:hypothetical protein
MAIAAFAPVNVPVSTMNIGDAIASAAGDLFNWLKSLKRLLGLLPM